jgi:uncharacterized membrane protein
LWEGDVGELGQQEWMVLVTAATPVLELRGAIPLGLALGLPVPTVLLLSYIGNLIPVPFILIGIGWVMNRLQQIPAVHAWLEDKAAKGGDKLHDAMQKWGWLGLLIFVAIPLPGTGAWTGSLAASVLRLPFWPSLLSIAGGVIIAGILVSGAGLGVLSLF